MAKDHLAIMASSVSAERAFSAAGITITKRRNRLKGDIVEALQILKCQLKTDIMHSNEIHTLMMELELERRMKAEEELQTEEVNNEDDDILDSDDDCYE